MKLRVKLAQHPAVVHRVEVENGAKLSSLQDALVASLPVLANTDAQSVCISLNRKTPLSDDPNALLSALGVCSGDLLWVLPLEGLAAVPAGGAGEGSTTAQPAAKRACAAADGAAPSVSVLQPPTGTTAPTASTSAAVAQPMEVDGSFQQPPRVPEHGGASLEAGHASSDRGHGGGCSSGVPPPPDSEASILVERHEELVQQHIAAARMDPAMGRRQGPLQRATAYLQAIMSTPSSKEATAVAAAGAITTSPSAATSPPLPHASHILLLLATHTALVDAGMNLASSLPPPTKSSSTLGGDSGGATSTLLLPPAAFPRSGVISLRYSYAPAGGAATTAVSNANQQGPSSYTDKLGVDNCAGGDCLVKAVMCGPQLMLHATAISGNRAGDASGMLAARQVVRTLHLSTRDEVDEGGLLQALFCSGRSGGRGADGEVNVDLRTQQDTRGGSGDAAGNRGEDTDGRGNNVFRHAKALWVRLRDELACWCVTAVCDVRGVPHPRGLLQLPTEIKELVLQNLTAKDMARTCCVCVELRHLGGDNIRWEPLFMDEFPTASPSLHSLAQHRGYKAAFAAAWRARRELEDWQRRMRHASRFHHPFRAPPGPPNPFWPAPPSGYRMPGIVGGDYDRLPALGVPHPGGAFSGLGMGFGVGGLGQLGGGLGGAGGGLPGLPGGARQLGRGGHAAGLGLPGGHHWC